MAMKTTSKNDSGRGYIQMKVGNVVNKIHNNIKPDPPGVNKKYKTPKVCKEKRTKNDDKRRVARDGSRLILSKHEESDLFDSKTDGDNIVAQILYGEEKNARMVLGITEARDGITRKDAMARARKRLMMIHPDKMPDMNVPKPFMRDGKNERIVDHEDIKDKVRHLQSLRKSRWEHATRVLVGMMQKLREEWCPQFKRQKKKD